MYMYMKLHMCTHVLSADEMIYYAYGTIHVNFMCVLHVMHNYIHECSTRGQKNLETYCTDRIDYTQYSL